jgi:hypothetical protein
MDREALERIEPEMTITFESPLLAAALKRDPKSVRRDVMKLERVGVLRAREEINPGHGRVKIAEPVAKRFELRASFRPRWESGSRGARIPLIA